MRLRKKKWVEPFLNSEKEYLLSDKSDLKTDKPVYLEIGMGMGDFIVESAFRNPGIFYVGLEKDETCVARAIKKAQEKEVNNLKIILTDADNMEELFDKDSIDCLYLHFSDPWPKKRNHKRRLTYPTFLKRYYQLLKNDGLLIFKSDNEGLFTDSVEYFKESEFVLEEINYDYHSVKRDEPMTGYENKFVSLGQPIYYMRYKKTV